jgi:hypothetical protein
MRGAKMGQKLFPDGVFDLRFGFKVLPGQKLSLKSDVAISFWVFRAGPPFFFAKTHAVYMIPIP